jgi:hypothetical protein
MKTTFIIIFISIAVLGLFYFSVHDGGGELYRGKTVTQKFYSRIVKDKFKIVVYLPNDYDPSNAKRYPVIYQLDGRYYGRSVAILMHRHHHLNPVLPEAIVVGIGYYYDGWVDKRERDYIFVGRGGFNEKSNTSGRGGGMKFYLFLKTELIPFIDNTFKTDNATYGRTLMGHSLGGYFAVFALFDQFKYTDMLEQPVIPRDVPVFANFIAASPVIVNDFSYIMDLERNISQNYTKPFPITLYMSMSNTEETTPTHYFPILSERLGKWDFAGYRFKSLALENKQHQETAIPIFKAGLKFIFN